MVITFYKYQATGNDFVIMDNREGKIFLTPEQINRLCDRKFGIGADGLIIVNNIEGYDFEMKYYNADGQQSSMCGNGGRCVVQFAFDLGLRREIYKFLAVDGTHEATFDENGWVTLKMRDIDHITTYKGDFILDTGSPHLVRQVENVMSMNVYKEGHEIRFSKDFEAKGINVDFVEQPTDREDSNIIVRTYERGVENETLSCGTGVTAAALVFAHNTSGFNRIEVLTRGGHLAVEFDKVGEDSFNNIWLCGPATFVFKGEIVVL